MNIEEQLKRYRENQNIIPDEQHIKETVRKSIESYCSVEQEKQLTYWEFLWTELHLIRKRWWLLQMLLLWTAATLLPYLLDNRYVIRMLGMIGVLFIVLMIWAFYYNSKDSIEAINGIFDMFNEYCCDTVLFISAEKDEIKNRLLLRKNNGGSELQKDLLSDDKYLDFAIECMKRVLSMLEKKGIKYFVIEEREK